MAPSLIKTIAQSIAARGKAQGWKPGSKTADNLNMECWAGAWMALRATGQDDAGMGAFVSMVVTVRGYRETLLIAERSDD